MTLPPKATVVTAPSLARLRAELLDKLQEREIDGLLGSATELNALGRIGTEDLLPRESPGQAEGRGPFVLEIGFPCWHYHAVQQMPFMGYGGMVTLAQRLIDPPRLLDGARGAVR